MMSRKFLSRDRRVRRPSALVCLRQDQRLNIVQMGVPTGLGQVSDCFCHQVKLGGFTSSETALVDLETADHSLEASGPHGLPALALSHAESRLVPLEVLQRGGENRALMLEVAERP
jgi:hypothetical protein